MTLPSDFTVVPTTTPDDVKLAERVVKLCPEIMGMCRTAGQLVRDPRVVAALVTRLETNNAEK